MGKDENGSISMSSCDIIRTCYFKAAKNVTESSCLAPMVGWSVNLY